MPLILKIAGQRIYMRGGAAQAQTHLYGVKDWVFVKNKAETPNFFSFTFQEPCKADGTRFVPVIRDEILVYKNEADYTADARWFGGLLTKVSDRMIAQDSSYVAGYAVEAGSFDLILEKELRQPQKAGLTWGELLIELLRRHFSTQLSTDYSGINNPLSAPPIRINNGNMRALLSNMRQLTGYDYTVDAYKKLHVYKSVDRPASFTLQDQPAGNLTVFDSRPEISIEGRAVFNIVRQPYQLHVGVDEWEGETFTAKGDPKGGGIYPLFRTPSSIEDTIQLADKFDGSVINNSAWFEGDTTTTENIDYPLQGFLFQAEGQLQVIGGPGTLGTVLLQSQDFYQYKNGAYIVQEFQITNTVGDGYIALFTDGAGFSIGNFKGGLRVHNNQLKALDDTVLVATLGTTTNYILWVTLTADGFQYDIYGGQFATKQTLRTETGIAHATDYKLCPVANKNQQLSINSFQYRSSDRNIILEINGVQKVVGLEQADSDYPDIDAYLNTDETPALLKFRGAEEITLIASVASNTVFTATTGSGSKFKPGHRLLIGDNLIEAFNGKEGYVASVAGDVVTLRSPGVTGMTTGKQILIGTTVPAKDDKLRVRYAYVKADETVAIDQASITKFGPFPITLPEKSHLRRFDDAQDEADLNLTRFSNGIMTVSFTSNYKLMAEPDAMTLAPVILTKRPDPINTSLLVQKVEIRPLGNGYAYSLQLESADPVKPFDEMLLRRNLVIGEDGALRFFTVAEDLEILDDRDVSVLALSSPYITWGNPGNLCYGQFKWKSVSVPGSTDLDFSNPDSSIYLPII